MSEKIQKIAVVIPKYGFVGGAEQYAFELTKRIAANPHYDVHVFANKWLDSSGNVTFHKVPIIKFPRYLTTPSFAYFVKHKLSQMKFDIIHTHERIIDADVFTMHGIPHRIWIHDIRKKRMSLFDYTTSWVEKTLVTGNKKTKLLAVSNLAKEKFIKEYTVDRERIDVIHPGVDIEILEKYDRNICRKEVRTQFNIPLSDKIILFVGMNFEVKGLEKIMMALHHLKIKIPSQKIKLLIVGKGNRHKYFKIANKIGVAKDIVFAGVIMRDQLDQIYLASDMFIMLSDFDSFGMSVLEAMAASLPVIISCNVGARDLVRQGVNGFIIDDTADSAAIAHSMAAILCEEKRNNMAKEAFNTATGQTWDAVTQKIENIYANLQYFTE
ncbi:MAG: glycosyltransferase family 4 protein [Syntrophaceae bacterium]